MTTTNKPMTGEQLDELMTVAVNMQRAAEVAKDRGAAMFSHAVQIAVMEIRDTRSNLADSQREFRSADATSENLQMKVDKLAAENAGMEAFVDALLSIVWQGGSADGAEIQEMALKHGLLRQEVYSADEHENLVDDTSSFEEGDPVYFRVETPETDAVLAEAQAKGVDAAIEHLLNKFAVTGHIGVPVMALEWLAKNMREGSAS
jgi:hypothetical protein